MQRTRLLCAGTTFASAIVAAIATSPVPAHAQKVVLNHNVFGPPRAVTAGIEAIADFYKKESNGDVEIKIAYGSALGPERQIPEAVKSGGYEGGQMCGGYYPNKFPLLTVMELPFLTPAKTAEHAKVYEAVIKHPLIAKEMADRWGIRYLGPVFLPTSSWATSASLPSTT